LRRFISYFSVENKRESYTLARTVFCLNKEFWKFTLRIMFWCDKIEKYEMGGASSTYRERRGIYMVLVGKSEGKRPLWRSRRRWENNIKVGLLEVGCGSMNWIELAQDRDRWRALVHALINVRVL
jgi:hypothetical protein